ncbi:conserved hypothetical protein [Ricinus communis]|uniref:Uncharacterized protein n=1 Tax=Ricinus communis TaxID=3988 RepID=B9SPL5_RICCO|nr:conserved hypothetical protein [Ricinus communis]
MEAKILEISNSLSNIKLKLQGSCYGADTSSLVESRNIGGLGDVIEVDNEKVDENVFLNIFLESRKKKTRFEDLNQNDDDDIHEEEKERDDDGDEEAEDDDEKENDERRRHSDDDSNSDNDGKGPNKDNIVLNEGNISVENINKSSGSGDKEDGKEVGGEEIDNAVSTILLMKSTKASGYEILNIPPIQAITHNYYKDMVSSVD